MSLQRKIPSGWIPLNVGVRIPRGLWSSSDKYFALVPHLGRYSKICPIIIGSYRSWWSRKDAWWRHQMKTFSALLALCAGSPVNSPHKGQWRGALMFSLICAWINNWLNNRKAGAHSDVIVMDYIRDLSVTFRKLSDPACQPQRHGRISGTSGILLIHWGALASFTSYRLWDKECQHDRIVRKFDWHFDNLMSPPFWKQLSPLKCFHIFNVLWYIPPTCRSRNLPVCRSAGNKSKWWMTNQTMMAICLP